MRYHMPLMAAALAAMSGYVPDASAHTGAGYNQVRPPQNEQVAPQNIKNVTIVQEKAPEAVVVEERVVMHDPAYAPPTATRTIVKTEVHEADLLGFSDADRVWLKEYLASHYNYCPPASPKGPACVPVMKSVHYKVGEPLASYVPAEYIPRQLSRQLEPLPVGYRYAFVDKDLVIFNEDTREIVDAINTRAAL